MNRRAFLCGLTGTLAAPLATEAQRAEKVYRLGYLSQSSGAVVPETRGIGLSGLTRGLRDLGWTDGQNLVIEARFTEGSDRRATGQTIVVELEADQLLNESRSMARR